MRRSPAMGRLAGVALVLLPGLAHAETLTVEPPPPDSVSVRGKPPPRSASDVEIDTDVVQASPKENGADIMRLVPGMFVGERNLLGRAPRLSLRGFDGTSGQDVEIFVANVPLNQVSHIRAPGYADMRLIMPEVVKSVRVQHGPFDPRQGDFAIAGSSHLDLGMDRVGFLSKGTYGSFGTRRLFLAFSPDDRHWRDSFAAFEAYSSDGVGYGRGGDRSSFVGQLAYRGSENAFTGIVAIGSARFDFPGFLPQDQVERGAYAYDAKMPLGRDRTAQALTGMDFTWRVGSGTLSIGGFASRTKTTMHQAFTEDDSEQVNDASTVGMRTAYKKLVDLTSKRDSVEVGAYARVDTLKQSDVRLNAGTRPVDAAIDATNIAGYFDASLYPIKRLVVRGGTRVDSLAYAIKEEAQLLERTSQGVHIGNKATLDLATGNFIHLMASYGDGFRSPQARDLREGERVPFATVRTVEAGMRMKEGKAWQASLVGFSSWLSQDRVFDPVEGRNAPAPASRRAGVATSVTTRWGVMGATASGTYARAVFTDSAGPFLDGDPVPYAPSFVLRSDVFANPRVGKLGDSPVVARFGVGVEGMAGRILPGGRVGKNAVFFDASAGLSWRAFELGVNAMNLLGHGYYDAQYVHDGVGYVLVAPPTSVFVTLQINLAGEKKRDRYDYE